MRMLLAMYDPSQPSADGSFWSWREPSLDRALLDRLYYDVAAADRPDRPNELGESTVVGGFAAFAADQAFVYRFGNGGRDAHGRPGRFVMVVAGLRLDPSSDIDFSEVLTCPAFTDVLKQAPASRPVPAPASLEIDLSVTTARADPVLVAKALREGRLELSGAEALACAAGVCGALPADRPWACRVRVAGSVSTATIECPRPVEAPAAWSPPGREPAGPTAIAPAPVSSAGAAAPAAFPFRSGILYAAVALVLLIAIAGMRWRSSRQKGDAGASPQFDDHAQRLQVPPSGIQRSQAAQKAKSPEQTPFVDPSTESKSTTTPSTQPPRPLPTTVPKGRPGSSPAPARSPPR